MATLMEICKMEVIKLGAPREELPKTILKEVEIMEEKMKTFFTGSFSNICNSSYSSLKIDLVDGEWHFTVCAQPTLKIRGGGSNFFGLPGGQLFLFPGRKVTIDDFKINLLEKEVIFHGTCSSSEDSTGRKFKSSLFFSPDSLLVITLSRIFEEQNGKDKFSKMTLKNENREMSSEFMPFLVYQKIISQLQGELDQNQMDSSGDEAELNEND